MPEPGVGLRENGFARLGTPINNMSAKAPSVKGKSERTVFAI